MGIFRMTSTGLGTDSYILSHDVKLAQYTHWVYSRIMDSPHETSLLIRFAEIVSFAEDLPLDILVRRHSEPIYPVTIGEHLVSHALGIVLRHNWESEENERVVGPLIETLHQLDTGVDRPGVWKELFAANRDLLEYLERQGEFRG